MPRRRVLELSVVTAAVLAAVLPTSPTFVERWFSSGIYPQIQRLVTPAANLAPFAWLDILLIVALVAGGVLVVRTWRRVRAERHARPAIHAGWTLVVAGAELYLVFLCAWGWNYRRVGMTDRVEMARETPRTEAVVALGMQAVEQLNALHAQAHADGWRGDEWREENLVRAFHEVQQSLEDTRGAVPGRLKRSLLAPYFRWTGVDGMVNPFGLEVIVNSDLLPWERPFVAAHEWSHLAGFADESEANFVAWLTCLRAGAPAEYSGWMYVFWEVAGEVGQQEREKLQAALAEGPRRDVAAVVERLRRGQLPALRIASWAVYDQYLRANRVEEGIRSYGDVINLILRTRFANGHRPIRRPVSASTR